MARVKTVEQKARDAENKQRWANENRERVREIHRAYRERNAEKEAARLKAFRENNPEKMREWRRDWKRKNPESGVAQMMRRRARKLNATPAWDADLTEFVSQEAADLARRREAATGFAWHVDHMIPLQACTVCGLHTWANLQVIPGDLNSKKSNRLLLVVPGEWLRHL